MIRTPGWLPCVGDAFDNQRAVIAAGGQGSLVLLFNHCALLTVRSTYLSSGSRN